MISVIKFLDESDIIKFNETVIDRQSTIIKPNELSSAVNSIAQTFGGKFLYESVFAMASHLCYALAENHCFDDGNKRTAYLSVLGFLEKNSIPINKIDSVEFAKKTLDLLLHKINEEEFTKYLEKVCK